MAASPSTDPRPPSPAKIRCRASAKLARPLAPEEIRRGQFVTLFDEIWEVPSYFWPADTDTLAREQTVRVRTIPSTGGVPLRVKSVCLPFVLVKQPDGKQRALDVRKCRLALLGISFAKFAWKALKEPAAAVGGTGC